MSDHDPNGDDDFLRNPMHKFGHGRGDNSSARPTSVRKHTMAYSYVDAEEAKKRHGGTATAALAATELMPAINPAALISKLIVPTTIKTIVSQIMEKDIDAWSCLSQDTKDLMLTTPESFTLTKTKNDGIPNIIYGGVELSWNGANDWVLVSIKASK